MPFVAAGGPLDYLRNLGTYQNGIFGVLSLRAWNPWWILQELGAGGQFVADGTAVLGPLTFRQLGFVIAGLLAIVVFVAVYRRPTADQLALGLAAISLAAFVSLTTMHERYAYPALVFLLLGDRATRRRGRLDHLRRGVHAQPRRRRPARGLADPGGAGHRHRGRRGDHARRRARPAVHGPGCRSVRRAARLVLPVTIDAADAPAGSRATPRWWSVVWLPPVIPVCFVILVWSQSQIELAWLVRPLALVVLGMLGITLLASVLAGSVVSGVAAATAIGVGLVVDDTRRAAVMVGIAGVAIVGGRLRPIDHYRYLPEILSAGRVFAICALGCDDRWRDQQWKHSGRNRQPAPRPRAGRPFEGRPADRPRHLGDPRRRVPGEDAAAGLDPAWDREAFPSALEGQGFAVQRHSRTDYLVTRLVLPAMFTGRLLTDILPSTDANLATQARYLREALNDGAVLHALGAAGYERIAISSGWSEIGPRRVDRLIEPPQMTEFEITLVRTTGVGLILDAVAPNLNSEQTRARIGNTYAQAIALANEPHVSPRFVFVHVPAPHGPMVFDASGGAVNSSEGSSIANWGPREGSREVRVSKQLSEATYIADQTVALTGAIQAASPRPPAIVVFSDHGTAIDWDGKQPFGGGIPERSSNLLAVLSPGHPGLMPPGTTPVNILPRLLRAYGVADLPLQPDSTWSYRTGTNILDLQEVDPADGLPRSRPLQGAVETGAADATATGRRQGPTSAIVPHRTTGGSHRDRPADAQIPGDPSRE